MMSARRYILCFCCIFLTTATPAFAKPDHVGKGHGNGNHGHHEDYDHNEDRDIDIDVRLISEGNRDQIRHYMAQDYYEGCPPGLAKKHNGCLPPGQAKKRYVIGGRLPSTVVYYPVPDYWLRELEPVPVGYQYVRVDKDVLLISEASHKVIDAITLLSAVGN